MIFNPLTLFLFYKNLIPVHFSPLTDYVLVTYETLAPLCKKKKLQNHDCKHWNTGVIVLVNSHVHCNYWILSCFKCILSLEFCICSLKKTPVGLE